MRWQRLFADLQAEFEEAAAAAERAEDGSRRRAEVGGVRLAERLAGAVGQPVAVRCRGAGEVTGLVLDVGADWLLLRDDQHREVLVAAGGVTVVGGLTRQTVPAAAVAVRARPDLRRAVRALVRDRATVQVVLDDGTALLGTLDRVGADFVELAEHPADRPRRAAEVRGVRTVALAAVAVVRTVPPSTG
ncbi:hypothetical protein [Geodermatophilus marinus]|uniref:hypothetical protein n=1 Tax=Geodermatophilus sp. LHW52908 TaxID=2303986 RepID=UPI000E3DCF63|nr:hypothetical protein [Geodermatophilus sp. LHW52908]RFU21796.1 hypothetical protein D0Z06_09145 [Geodermatophilus sp. LHW52908]